MKSLIATNITDLGMLPMRLDLKTGRPFGSAHDLLFISFMFFPDDYE